MWSYCVVTGLGGLFSDLALGGSRLAVQVLLCLQPTTTSASAPSSFEPLDTPNFAHHVASHFPLFSFSLHLASFCCSAFLHISPLLSPLLHRGGFLKVHKGQVLGTVDQRRPDCWTRGSHVDTIPHETHALYTSVSESAFFLAARRPTKTEQSFVQRHHQPIDPILKPSGNKRKSRKTGALTTAHNDGQGHVVD